MSRIRSIAFLCAIVFCLNQTYPTQICFGQTDSDHPQAFAPSLAEAIVGELPSHIQMIEPYTVEVHGVRRLSDVSLADSPLLLTTPDVYDLTTGTPELVHASSFLTEPVSLSGPCTCIGSDCECTSEETLNNACDVCPYSKLGFCSDCGSAEVKMVSYEQPASFVEEDGDDYDYFGAAQTQPAFFDIVSKCTDSNCLDPGCSAQGQTKSCSDGCCESCTSSCCVTSESFEPTMDRQLQAYCRQVGDLLSSTLESHPDDAEAREKAVYTAMEMIAEKIQFQSTVKLIELDAIHQERVSALQTQCAELTSQLSPNASMKAEALAPLLQNQERNYRYIRSLAQNNAVIRRTLEQLDKKVSNATAAQLAEARQAPIRNHFVRHETSHEAKPKKESYEQQDESYRNWMARVSNANVRIGERVATQQRYPAISIAERTRIAGQQAMQADRNYLAKEIDSLQKRLIQIQGEMEALTDKEVRPVGHLEPMYRPEHQLQPLYNR